jgi:DNA repair exonuclease SbcCD ATPase subunit
MIVFEKVKWKNFLSTGNLFTEVPLNQNSSTLIVGTNGSGKSTLLDALCFGLFGKPFRNINKPQLMNSINQKDCLVEIEFSIKSKNYKIVRGIKPAIFEIYADNELVNQNAATKDYQEFLEKNILKLNFKSFTQIVILGSASFVPFMQLSAADRRAIIEDLLDIQIFSKMNTLIKEKTTTNKDDILRKKNQQNLLEKLLTVQLERLNELKQNNVDRISEYELEITNNNSSIVELQKSNDNLKREINLRQEIVDSLLSAKTKIKKVTKLESQIENNISKIDTDLTFFATNDSCPTCKQAIQDAFKQNILSELNTKKTECLHGLELLKSKIDEEQKKIEEINTAQEDIQKYQTKIAVNNTSISSANDQIAKLQKQIDTVRNSKNVDDLEKNEIASLKEQQVLCETDLKNLMNEKKYLDFATTLLKDGGIKTKIVRQYLPIINRLVNRYLSALDFFVNFNLDEAFKETIKSRHRDEFSYASFSEGEKQRIDMALMLTWRAVAKIKNSANTNLLILDEIFDSSLDTNGTEELMKILNLLEDTNLFIISHKGDILQDKFRNVIRFDKVNNFSRIVK